MKSTVEFELEPPDPEVSCYAAHVENGDGTWGVILDHPYSPMDPAEAIRLADVIRAAATQALMLNTVPSVSITEVADVAEKLLDQGACGSCPALLLR